MIEKTETSHIRKTPHTAVLFLKIWSTRVQLIKLFPASLEPEGLLPSQSPSIWLNPELMEFSLHQNTQQILEEV
jgi:hypothetical protein